MAPIIQQLSLTAPLALLVLETRGGCNFGAACSDRGVQGRNIKSERGRTVTTMKAGRWRAMPPPPSWWRAVASSVSHYDDSIVHDVQSLPAYMPTRLLDIHGGGKTMPADMSTHCLYIRGGGTGGGANHGTCYSARSSSGSRGGHSAWTYLGNAGSGGSIVGDGDGGDGGGAGRGSRNDPLTWNELKHMIETSELDAWGRPTAPATMGRSPSENGRYREFREELKQTWRSTLDYLLCRVFDWSPSSDVRALAEQATGEAVLRTTANAASTDDAVEDAKRATANAGAFVTTRIAGATVANLDTPDTTDLATTSKTATGTLVAASSSLASASSSSSSSSSSSLPPPSIPPSTPPSASLLKSAETPAAAASEAEKLPSHTFLKVAVPPPPSLSSQRNIVYRANDFPYWFEPEVTHDVIWVSRPPPLTPAEIEKEILLRGLAEKGREVLWWANPPALKSVPEIDHVHVVSRPRSPE